MRPITFLTLFIAALLSISCVGKKKYEAVIAENDITKQGFENRISILDRTLIQKNKQIDTLSLLYAETKGANAALLATQDKHLDRIDEVQDQLQNVQKDKSSTAKNLNAELEEKDKIIAGKDAQLTQITSMIDQFESDNQAIVGNLKYDLDQLFGAQQAVEYVNQEIHIIYNEDLLFPENSARIRSIGRDNLQKIADLVNSNPSLVLYVIGNTDNNKTKGFTDNWDFSVFRATSVVRFLTEELGLSPNRVIAAGKGEFSPMASNETKEGQAANRRIEFVILPRMDKIIKEIRKEAGGE